jgi:hypothetical protein
MNRKFIICICTLVTVVFGSGNSLGCPCQEPVPDLSLECAKLNHGMWAYVVCAGDAITFDATGSFDPDCENCSSCNGVSLVNGIRKFEWDWTDNGSYDYSEEPGDGKATHVYEVGEYTVRLRVTDNDDDCCCSGPDCDDADGTITIDLIVMEVDFSPDQVRVPIGGNAPLEATVNPSLYSFEMDFETEDSSIATVSGSPPNLTVSGESAGATEVQAKLDGYPGEDCVCETADVIVGCTPGRKYVKAIVVGGLVTKEVRATIKTRYGVLCCENCDDVTVTAFQVAQVGMGNVFSQYYWGLMGYARQRNKGFTEIIEYRFWEVVNLDHPEASDDFYDDKEAPDDGESIDYKVKFDKSTGEWKFYYNNSFWDDFDHYLWEGKAINKLFWQGEISNKEDDMVGTDEDRCEFTDCGYSDESGSHIAGFKESDIKSDDENEWMYELVSTTAFKIWDKNPGESVCP